MSVLKKPTTKEKGDLLEDVVEGLCSGLQGSKVTRNAKLDGRRSKTKRDIDVLIKGKINAFEVKIAIEAKHYKERVGVERIESLQTKLDDVGVDLGVMVSSKGFSQPAKETADSYGIQLFEVYDQRLENSSLFLPVRFIAPEIARYQVGIQHRSIGPFQIVKDPFQWRIHIGDKILTVEELLVSAWEDGRVPQKAGTHEVKIGAVALSEVSGAGPMQYCEMAFTVEVIERYYLKLFPASYFRSTSTKKEHHRLFLDIYSRQEDMIKNGWKEYRSREEMDAAADIPNQPEGIKNLIVYAETSMDNKPEEAAGK